MGLDLVEPMSARDAVTAPILLVTDPADCGDLGPFDVVHVDSVRDAVSQLLTRRFACVVLDMDFDALAQVRTAALDVPVILLATDDDQGLAVRAVREGAQDVLIRPAGGVLRRAIALAVERKGVEARLAHQALHDDLTGLPNRALFLDRLGQALPRLGRHATSLAVLFLDLDKFKAVNDVLGHAAGDELLSAVAARLEGILRAGDTAARLSGDEFAVLCEDVAGERHAIGVAERVAEALRSPFALGGDEGYARSGGRLALGVHGAEEAETLLREAGAAVDRAQQRGGGGDGGCERG